MPRGIYKRTKEQREKWKQVIEKWLNSPKGKKAIARAATLGAKKRWEGHIKVKKKYECNLEKKRFTNQRYKARKRNALGSHTFGEWELLKKQYGYVCPACGGQEPEVKLTEDHIIPLSRGGSDFIENIQPLCVSCNTKKMTKTIKYSS